MYYFILIVYFQFLVNYLIISKVNCVDDEKGKGVAESTKPLKNKNMPPSYFIIEMMDKVVENLDKISKVEEKSLKIRGETSSENENKMEVIEEEDENETKGEEEDKLKKKKEKNEKEREHLIKLSEVVRSKYILPKMAEINVLTSLIYQFLFSNNPNEGLSSSKLGNIFKEINEASEKNMEFEEKLKNDEDITVINKKEGIFVEGLIYTVFQVQGFFGKLKLEIVLGQKLEEFSNEKLDKKIKIEEERINDFLKNYMIDKNEYLMIKYGKKKKGKLEGAMKNLKKFKEKIQIKKDVILPPNSSKSKKIIKDEEGNDLNNQKQEAIDKIKEAILDKINKAIILDEINVDLIGVKIYYGRSIWMNRLAQVSIILQKHILEIIKQEKTSWSELTKTSLKNYLNSSQNSEKSTIEEINEKTIFDIYTKKVNESNSQRFGNELFSKKGKNNKIGGLGFMTPQASPMRVFTNSLGCKDVGECSSKNNEQKRYSFSFASPIKSFVASPRRFFSQKKDSFSKSGKSAASNKLYKNSRSLAIIWFFAERTLKPILLKKFDEELNIEAKNIINSLEFDPKILKNKWVEGWEDVMANEDQKLFWKETIILGLRVLTAFERMKKIYELKDFATTVIGKSEFKFETLENEEKLIEDISEELEEAVLKKLVNSYEHN